MRSGPDTFAELARILGVEDASDDQQFEAIVAWYDSDDAEPGRGLYRSIAAKGGRWFDMVDSRRSMNAPTYPKSRKLSPQEMTEWRQRNEALYGGRFRQWREVELRRYVEAGLEPPDDLR